MNPLYAQLMGGQTPPSPPPPQQPPAMSGGMRFANPMQKMQYMMQAMQNPAAFVRQHLQGIPEQAFNDPSGNGVLRYMMQNMGVTPQDVRNVQNQNQIPGF